MQPSESPPTSNTSPSGRPLRLKLKVRSFRAFRDESSIELRPLTLLYGHNQAGKSSLLRLVPLIADSLRPGATALDLQSPSLRGASLKELGWMGRDPALSPWITLAAPTTTIGEPTLALQYADDGGLVVNQVRLTPRESGDKFGVSLDGEVRRDQQAISAPYAGMYRGKEWTGTLTFNRLIPDGLPEQAAQIAREVAEALEPLSRAQWLHANRLGEGSTETARRTSGCAPDGSDLASILREARHRVILEAASEWIRQQPGLGTDVEVHPDSSGRPQLVLGHPGRERLPLHLAGEGLRALLPILLCACWGEVGRCLADSSAPTLLAVEEPEAHLHPDLQVALFNRLLGTVRSGVPVIMETHSVYVLRAMQLAVLNGLDPAQIGLYWVAQDADGAASVTPVGIETDATLAGWRPLAFEQEHDLAHQILDLRWKQLGAT